MLGETVEFRKYFLKGLEIIRLRKTAAEEAAKDERSLVPGLVIVGVGGFMVAFAAALHGETSGPVETALMLFFAPALNVLMFSLFIAIFHGIARLFGGKAKYQEYYRAAALSWIIAWAQPVPYIGPVVSLWSIPVNVIILESVHKLRRLEAAAVIAAMMSLVLGFLYLTGLLG